MSAPADPYSLARLRQGFIAFAVGKLFGAVLSGTILLLLAADLSRSDFAAYVWLMAFGRIAIEVSQIGLNWLALYRIPVLRTLGAEAALRHVILKLLGLRSATAIAIASLAWLASLPLLQLLGTKGLEAGFQLYLLALIAELMAEFLRECIFGPLLRQLDLQANLLARNAALLAMLLVQSRAGGGLTLDGVITAYLMTAWGSFALALGQLAWILWRLRGGGVADRKSGADDRRFALDNYAHDMLRLAGSAQALILLGAQLIDHAALGAFGLAREVVDMLDRVQPGRLFISLLRPMLVNGYVRERDFAALNRRANLIVKIANGFLAAALVVTIAHGAAVLELFASGAWRDALGFIIAFILIIGLGNLQQLLSVIVNSIGRAEVLRRAALSSLLTLPLAAALVAFGLGGYGMVAAILAAAVIYTLYVLKALERAGQRCHLDGAHQARLAVAGLLASLFGMVATPWLPDGPVGTTSAIVLTLLAFVAAVALARVFTPDERATITRLIGIGPASPGALTFLRRR